VAASPLEIHPLDIELGALIRFAYGQGFGPRPLPVDPGPAGYDLVARGTAQGNLEARCYYAVKLMRKVDGLKVLAIRGTADVNEWKEDAEFWPERCPWGPGKTEGGMTDIITTLAADDPEAKPLWDVDAVVGHSLGAAIAEGIGAEFSVPYVGLWAAPRLGDGDARAALLARCKLVLRPYMQGDLVPDLPFDLPPIFTYLHPPGFELEPAPGTAWDPETRHALDTYLTAAALAMKLPAPTPAAS
jgi:hypothetical protein